VIKDLLVAPEPHQLVSLKKRSKIGKERRRALDVGWGLKKDAGRMAQKAKAAHS